MITKQREINEIQSKLNSNYTNVDHDIIMADIKLMLALVNELDKANDSLMYLHNQSKGSSGTMGSSSTPFS